MPQASSSEWTKAFSLPDVIVARSADPGTVSSARQAARASAQDFCEDTNLKHRWLSAFACA